MVLYISRLMKAREVRQACATFRDYEARKRRLQIRLRNKKAAASKSEQLSKCVSKV